jgi:beta-phosphoglucomutase-like phosphatase (HAD superfamily)
VKIIPVDPKAKALIFDCDGTLADTMPLHWQAWHEALADLQKTIPQEFLDQRKGVPAADIIEEYNRIFCEDVDTKQFIERKQQKAIALLPQTKGIEPVVAIVREHQGKLPMAVASGGTRNNVLFTLKAIGLEKVFDAVVTADDDVAPKPSPEIFLEAARQLGVDPEFCIVFEDGDPGIEGAKKAGMMVVDVREYFGK